MLLRAFKSTDLQTFRQWFDDPDIAARISYPTDAWMEYVQDKNVTCHTVVNDNGKMVGVAQTDRDVNNHGWCDLIIAPHAQGHGLGTAALGLLVEKHAHLFDAICAAVEVDNLASISCLQANGFAKDPMLNDDDLLIYRKHHSQRRARF